MALEPRRGDAQWLVKECDQYISSRNVCSRCFVQSGAQWWLKRSGWLPAGRTSSALAGDDAGGLGRQAALHAMNLASRHGLSIQHVIDREAMCAGRAGCAVCSVSLYSQPGCGRHINTSDVASLAGSHPVLHPVATRDACRCKRLLYPP